jgi:hypothetical protein
MPAVAKCSITVYNFPFAVLKSAVDSAASPMTVASLPKAVMVVWWGLPLLLPLLSGVGSHDSITAEITIAIVSIAKMVFFISKLL